MENIFHCFLASRLFICLLEVSFPESTKSSAKSIQLYCLSTTATLPALRTSWPHQDGLVQHWQPRCYMLDVWLSPYWLYMLTTGVWRVLVRYLSVTVCIFQSNFSLRKRDRKFELFWLENESVTTWHRREFSRNICSNDHETSFPSSSNTQFELLFSTRTRSSVGMGKSLVKSRTVDRNPWATIEESYARLGSELNFFRQI